MHPDSCPLDVRFVKVILETMVTKLNWNELWATTNHSEVWVAKSPPDFAFVEFEDYQITADTVQELDGRTM